jgi:hypothetical protein
MEPFRTHDLQQPKKTQYETKNSEAAQVSEECTCYNACCHWLPLDGKGVEIWSTQIWDRERTLEESQYNNQKNTPTQAALLPSLLKTILTVQLTNQLQNIILHGTYLNNHT